MVLIKLLLLLISISISVQLLTILPNDVLNHLSISNGQFDAWTEDLGNILNPFEQQQLAWNVQWPLNLNDIKDIESKLRPTNELKLLLWMSYYWHLRRSHRIPKDVLHQHFVLNLVRLHREEHSKTWNNQLENMLMTFPQSLRIVLKSHWLCLQHGRDYLYAGTGDQLELGANSNCSMWQIDRHRQINESDTNQHWLRLRNVCEMNYVWFINLLTMIETDMIMLHHAPNNMAKIFCLKQGSGYYKMKPEDLMRREDCQWQLNNCSHLPKLLMGTRNRG